MKFLSEPSKTISRFIRLDATDFFSGGGENNRHVEKAEGALGEMTHRFEFEGVFAAVDVLDETVEVTFKDVLDVLGEFIGEAEELLLNGNVKDIYTSTSQSVRILLVLSEIEGQFESQRNLMISLRDMPLSIGSRLVKNMKLQIEDILIRNPELPASFMVANELVETFFERLFEVQ